MPGSLNSVGIAIAAVGAGIGGVAILSAGNILRGSHDILMLQSRNRFGLGGPITLAGVSFHTICGASSGCCYLAIIVIMTQRRDGFGLSLAATVIGASNDLRASCGTSGCLGDRHIAPVVTGSRDGFGLSLTVADTGVSLYASRSAGSSFCNLALAPGMIQGRDCFGLGLITIITGTGIFSFLAKNFKYIR